MGGSEDRNQGLRSISWESVGESLSVLRVGVVLLQDSQVPFARARRGLETGCVVNNTPLDINSRRQVQNGYLEVC